MPKRKANSPWGAAYKEGLPTTAVNDQIIIDQEIIPAINTGVIDVNTGQWEGVITSDKHFFLSDTATGIANGGTVLFPNTDASDWIDMTGYSDLFIALKPSNGGNYAVSAVMGPSDRYFANLTPVNAAALLKGAINRNDMDTALVDSAEAMTVDVWNIFYISNRVQNQKLLQWLIVNNSGGASDIDFAYLRVV